MSSHYSNQWLANIQTNADLLSVGPSGASVKFNQNKNILFKKQAFASSVCEIEDILFWWQATTQPNAEPIFKPMLPGPNELTYPHFIRQPDQHALTHWSLYASIKYTIIASDNGLSPGRRQAIIWTNAWILLIGPLGTNISEI